MTKLFCEYKQHNLILVEIYRNTDTHTKLLHLSMRNNVRATLIIHIKFYSTYYVFTKYV